MMFQLQLLAGAVALALAFGAGWQTRAWKAGADDAAQVRADASTARKQAANGDVAATRHEATRATLQRQDAVLVKEIERVVEKPVYRTECIDADGLRIIAAALSGAADPGEPAPAVPDTGPAD